jgi:transglutaminase-like putative cysteine protease
VDLSPYELDGVGQTLTGLIVEIRDPQSLKAERADPDARKYLAPEPFIESDAPEIEAEAEIAVRGATGVRDRAEKLTRYVNAILDKKPTVSLPSAREVLRTRVGDCNEHTVLYVALARALGLPARTAAGVVYLRGQFYYHAWPEVWLGQWVAVDPTFGQFPADAAHLRFVIGGLARQVELIRLIGRLQLTVVP